VYSREEPIQQIMAEDGKLQYDDRDPLRIGTAADIVTQATINLIDKLGAYRDEVERAVDEDTESRMRLARQELVEVWAAAQAAVSAVAVTFRIDGNDAYERLAASMRTEGYADMHGL
jgi:hypothetical protein